MHDRAVTWGVRALLMRKKSPMKGDKKIKNPLAQFDFRASMKHGQTQKEAEEWEEGINEEGAGSC